MRNKKSTRQKSNRRKLLLEEREKFYKLYPDQDSHIRSLCKISGSRIVTENSKTGYLCPKCESKNIQKHKGPRLLKCRNCGKKFRPTAGTIFEGVKRPDAWNMAYHFYSKSLPVNSEELALLADIVQASAFEIIKQISVIALKLLEKYRTTISSAAFEEIICKRSLVTPAGLRPNEELEIKIGNKEAEIREIEESNKRKSDEFLQNVKSKLSSLSADERAVFEVIKEEPISLDEICKISNISVSRISASIVVLEMEDLIECLAGDRFTKKKIQSDSTSENKIPQRRVFTSASSCIQEESTISVLSGIADCIKEFIGRVYNGISRKYLQLYIALYCLTCTKKQAKLLKVIEKIAKYSTPITRDTVREFDTPADVSIPCSAT